MTDKDNKNINSSHDERLSDIHFQKRDISLLKLLKHTINSIREMLVVTDANNKILYINSAFSKVYGYSVEEAVGQQIDLIRSEKNDPNIYKEIYSETRVKGRWTGVLYDKKKSGESFLVSLNTSIVKDDTGDPVALVGGTIDLTEQINSETILRETEEKYKSLFLELKETIYESTPDGKLLDINPSGVELFGYSSKEELLKADIARELYLNEKDREAFKNKLEKDGFVKNYEIDIKTKSGDISTVLETSMVVRDKDGKIQCYRGILRDITEAKHNQALLTEYLEKLANMNEQLKNSEANLKRLNNEKDKFFSIIAHDLKSPFNSLLGLSEFLIEDINELSQDEIKSFAQAINVSAQNVFKLLDNLLQWSQIQTGRMKLEPERFKMSEVILSANTLLSANAENKGVILKLDLEKDTEVYADKNMISSVVRNLLSNAIKFSNQNDSVTITINNREKEVLVSVMDTGIGMKPEICENLFKINRNRSMPGTNNELGTGLGLILCKELVEKNEGQIWVESKFGEGSEFCFTLPKGIQ
ncbi:MAG: PAS domain-containing sensor histidine kinase [Melioribacteraceae bacterium]|nr:PAS domain-containing sensor histidine kinase [Melioribacteraceae bacterium]